MRESVLLEEMTWPRVGRLLDEGWTTIVIPVGAVEQHGPHLPLLTDADRGTWLGVAVARRLGRALVAPTIRVGCSEHHMGFPGTLSLRSETLRAVLQDYCTSLARHGFRTLCLLPSHGGNFGPLRAGLPALEAAAGPGCRVLAYTDLEGFLDLWREAVEAAAGLGNRVGGHADVAESSEMLVLRPELVQEELAEEGYTGPLSGEVLDRLMARGFDSVTPNGILGDARGLDPAVGRVCLDRVADALARHFREAVGDEA